MVRTGEHLGLAGMGLLLGIMLAIPLAFILERWRKGAETMIRVVGMSQTIPSIALLAFMIPLFGVGALPAIMALWIYSLYPIVRNTFSGLRDAAPSVVETGRALGMTEWQILRSVRLPTRGTHDHGGHSNSRNLDRRDRNTRGLYWSRGIRSANCLGAAISRCACDSLWCITRHHFSSCC